MKLHMTNEEQQSLARWQEIRDTHYQYRDFYQILVGCLIVGVLVTIGAAVFAADLPEYWQNIYVTFVGAALTVFVLDRRAAQRALRREKSETLLQLLDPDPQVIHRTLRLLEHRGWLRDDTLKGAYLEELDLQRLNFSGADLSGADLSVANLQWANLENTNLHNAALIGTNLKGAELRGAQMENVRYSGYSPTGEELFAILPDGTLWVNDADVLKFTVRSD